jgi:hypothetical protein
MFAHPVLAAVLALDAMALALLGAAVVTAVRVVLGWSPASSASAQLALEARAEGASLLGRIGSAALLGATLLLVGAIAGVLPSIVPGAMCGTGVLQSMDGLGGRALALRGIALGLLAAWHLIDRLNRQHPRAPLTVAAGRGLLLAAPLVVLAVVYTVRALWSLDVQSPVDCCAAVYDRVAPAGADGQAGWQAGRVWTWAAIAGAVVLVVLGVATARVPGPRWRVGAAVLAGLSLPWALAAAWATVRHLAAYQYGVLHHRCPWCLLLTEHYAVGFAVFGALAVVAFEGPLALIAARFAIGRPAVAAAAERRGRAAGVRVALAVIAFWLVAGVPPLVWRFRFGTWMH